MHMKCSAQYLAHDKGSVNVTDDNDDEEEGDIVYHDILANCRADFWFGVFCFILLLLSCCKGI